MSGWAKPTAPRPLPPGATRDRALESAHRIQAWTAAVPAVLVAAVLYAGTATAEEPLAAAYTDSVSVPAKTPAEGFDDLIARLRDADLATRLREVNRFFNAMPYRSDRELWHQRDYWAQPAELMAKRAGDCEDFAIGKYFALRALGVPDEELAIVYAYDVRNRTPHMVLIWSAPGDPAMVLDRRTASVFPRSAHRNLILVYGFNAAATFVLPAAPDAGVYPRRVISARHRRWGALLESTRLARTPANPTQESLQSFHLTLAAPAAPLAR